MDPEESCHTETKNDVMTDDGTGERGSNRCEKEVLVRIIVYTPSQEKVPKCAKRKL